MSGFNSWEEVKNWLSTNHQSVSVDGIWYFSKNYMSCYNDCCCEEHFKSLTETMESLRYYADSLEEVTKNEK